MESKIEWWRPEDEQTNRRKQSENESQDPLPQSAPSQRTQRNDRAFLPYSGLAQICVGAFAAGEGCR